VLETGQVERQLNGAAVRVTVGTASSVWDCAALKKEQVDGRDVGSVVREVKAGQRSKWTDVAIAIPYTRITVLNASS
jgi:hypothetical protein